MKQKYIHPMVSIVTIAETLMTTTSLQWQGSTDDTLANEAKRHGAYDDGFEDDFDDFNEE